MRSHARSLRFGNFYSLRDAALPQLAVDSTHLARVLSCSSPSRPAGRCESEGLGRAGRGLREARSATLGSGCRNRWARKRYY